MAGIYRHYKGHLYLLLGQGQDANVEGRTVVVYVGLDLDGAKNGYRICVRTLQDFTQLLNPATGESLDDKPDYTGELVERFVYVGPTVTP